MMIRIRDLDESEGRIVAFRRIAAAVNDVAADCTWKIENIAGSLIANSGMTIADAHSIAELTSSTPWSWKQLRGYTEKYFQIWDCEFLGQRAERRLKIECFDATYWEIYGLRLAEAKAVSSAFSCAECLELE